MAQPALMLPGLSDDLGLRCLAHVPWQCQGQLLLVCSRWSQLILDGSLARARKAANKTEPLLGCAFQLTSEETGDESMTFQAFNPERCHLASRKLPRPISPTDLRQCTTGAPGGLAFVTSGISQEEEPVQSEVWKYDVDLNCWRTLLLRGLYIQPAVQVLKDGRVLRVGGLDSYCPLQPSRLVTVTKDDLTASEEGPSVVMGRARAVLLEVGEEVWLIGGNTGNFSKFELAKTIEKWRHGTMSWSVMEASWLEYGGNWGTIDGKLYYLSLPAGDDDQSVLTRANIMVFDTVSHQLSREKLDFDAYEDHMLQECHPVEVKGKLFVLAEWVKTDEETEEEQGRTITVELVDLKTKRVCRMGHYDLPLFDASTTIFQIMWCFSLEA